MINSQATEQSEKTLKDLFQVQDGPSKLPQQNDEQFVTAVMKTINQQKRIREFISSLSVIACTAIIVFLLTPLLQSFSLSASSFITGELFSVSLLLSSSSTPLMYLFGPVIIGLLYTFTTDFGHN